MSFKSASHYCGLGKTISHNLIHSKGKSTCHSHIVWYLNRLYEPIFMAGPKPMQTEFGIHHRLNSCGRNNVSPRGFVTSLDFEWAKKIYFSLRSNWPVTTFLSISEKTPKCLINELARHNKISLEYVRVDESGKTRNAMLYQICIHLTNLHLNIQLLNTYSSIESFEFEKL